MPTHLTRSVPVLRAVLMTALLLVGTGCQRCVNAAAEGGGEAAVAAVADHVVHAPAARHLGGAVAAAVVDDQELDRVDPLDPPGKRGDRFGQRAGLVEAGYLDDQLGHVAPEGHPALSRALLSMTV